MAVHDSCDVTFEQSIHQTCIRKSECSDLSGTCSLIIAWRAAFRKLNERGGADHTYRYGKIQLREATQINKHNE